MRWCAATPRTTPTSTAACTCSASARREAYEEARVKVQTFLNAAGRARDHLRARHHRGDQPGGADLRPRQRRQGDEVLITEMEHHSNIVPWQLHLRGEGRAAYGDSDHRRAASCGWTSLEQPADRSHQDGRGRPRLELAGHDQSRSRTIVEMAHARGIPVLVDGAQAVAHMPVDVQALGCDFYAMSGHKLFGPTGIGVLYGQAALLEAMPPYQGGGDMISSVTFEKTTYNVVPNKFEAGTPNIAGAVGLGAAIDYLKGIGHRRDRSAYEDELLAYGTKALSAVPGIRLIGTASNKASVLSFVMEDVHPHDIGTILDQRGRRHPDGPPLHAAADGAPGRAGHRARVAGAVQYRKRKSTRSSALSPACARCSPELNDGLTRPYQEVILDHNKRPRNFRVPDPVNRKAEGYNPLCGDKITVFLYVEGDMIKDLGFQGTGCAISKASASMMTDALKGKTVRRG